MNGPHPTHVSPPDIVFTDLDPNEEQINSLSSPTTQVLSPLSSFAISAVVCHILASCHPRSNAFGARVPISTSLNIQRWANYLTDYDDRVIVDFLAFGWPINYSKSSLPLSSKTNHASAIEFHDHVQHFIDTELSYHALAGPFEVNPLPHNLVRSPLQTVPKRNSSKRRVVMDLSYPSGQSVNSGIPKGQYLKRSFPTSPTRD